VASVPLTFAATGTYQWPRATLSATFPNPTVEGSTFHAAVEDMSPWNNVISPHFPSAASVDVCRDDGDLTGDDCRRGLDWEADRQEVIALGQAGGTAGSGQLRLPRHLPGSPAWDCAVDGCVLVVTQDGTDDVVGNPRTQAVPITYAPEWAPWASAAQMIDRAVEPLVCTQVVGQAGLETAMALADRSLTGAELLARSAGTGICPDDIGEVVRLYRAFFGRMPETGGLAYWLDRLHTGTTATAMARAFGGTPEFRTTYGTASNGTVVDRAYRNTLGRAPDAAGRAYWVSRLQQGMARSTLLHHFSRSPEMRAREGAHVALTRLTWTLRHRAPTGAEVETVDADPGIQPLGGFHGVAAGVIAEVAHLAHP
jgi:hypothetical protein